MMNAVDEYAMNNRW